MAEIAEVSWIIKFLDFLSNIFIGFIICLVSFVYLLQSETIGDVVLNSFALTFILELDDLANLFESDEDALMNADWSQFLSSDRGDWEIGSFRRNIKIELRVLLMAIALVLLSPLFILQGVFVTVTNNFWKDPNPDYIQNKLHQLYVKKKE